MRPARALRALAWGAAALLGLAGFTGWALEASDVAVLTTQRPDGRVGARVWVGLLQDTSRSLAVLLHPRESGAGSDP